MKWRELGIAIPVEGQRISLEGAWQNGSGGSAVVAPPHPVYGGSLNNPVVNEMAFGFYRRGLSSLRFNWRGVGASQGTKTADLECAVEDFRAALHYGRETSDGALIVGGSSFGAVTALMLALEDTTIEQLGLVAPPVQMLQGLKLESLTCRIVVIVGGSDPYAPVPELRGIFGRLQRGSVLAIPGVDHTFSTTGLSELNQLVSESTELGVDPV